MVHTHTHATRKHTQTHAKRQKTQKEDKKEHEETSLYTMNDLSKPKIDRRHFSGETHVPSCVACSTVNFKCVACDTSQN